MDWFKREVALGEPQGLILLSPLLFHDHEYAGPRGKRMNHDVTDAEIRTKAKSGVAPFMVVAESHGRA